MSNQKAFTFLILYGLWLSLAVARAHISHFLENKLSPEELRDLTKVTKLIRKEPGLEPRPLSLYGLTSQKGKNNPYMSHWGLKGTREVMSIRVP